MLAFIKNKLNSILIVLSWNDINYNFWISKNIKNGHLNSNLVVIIAQHYKLDPNFVSKKLINEFSKLGIFTDIFYQKPFLCFLLRQDIFTHVITKVLQEKESFGKINIGQKQKLNYEWVSANPTGYLHFGHARNIFIGQIITNLLEFVNYDVTREFYINDYGNQVYQLGRTVFYYYQKFLNLNPESFDEMYKNAEVKPLGALAFAKFKESYKDVNFVQDKVVQKKFINFASNFFLKAMKTDLSSWGLEFDVWFSEKSFYESGYYEKFLKKLKEKKIVYKKDGAFWFDASKTDYKQDFVLIKSDGEPAYFLGDIMYHDNKLQRQFDLIIDLFGADHHSHFLKIVAGLKGLGWDSQKANVDLLQMVKVAHKDQVLKISKRQGTTVSIHDLAKKIGLNFLKFLLISKKKETPLIFNLTNLTNKSNQHPFFYIQYSYVRCYQLLKKFSSLKTKFIFSQYSLLTSQSEQNLILNLQYFTFLIRKTAAVREPQLLADFLMKLAKNFHSFYQNNSILNASNDFKRERLALVQAVYQVLSNIATIIGFVFPKKISKKSH